MDIRLIEGKKVVTGSKDLSIIVTDIKNDKNLLQLIDIHAQ